jgi:hypothetical protein
MNRFMPYAVPAVLVLAVLLAVGGWFLFAKKGTTPGGTSVSEQGASGAPGSQARQRAGAAFAFQRLAVDTSQDRPEACLVFSRELDASGETKYADYLKLDPAIPYAVRVNGSALCLGGLNYADKYTVTIRAGLPSADGAKTAFDETVPVELTDRPAGVSFSGGIILPRESEGKVPVTTVNVEKLDIRVLRVGDRLLSQLSQGLVDETQLYSWSTDSIENEMGALVWKGTMEVEGTRNATITTLIPLRDAIKGKKAGVYLVLAKDANAKKNLEDYWSGVAAQWVIDTDIGLTTFQGGDGLHVFARSLSSAAPISGVSIVLVAHNNEELARASSDESGSVHFNNELMTGKGGNQPVVVMAYRSDDFSYLDLRRPAFDLTDRGVAGRPAAGPIDAYLYLDRGIYRPGETVHVTTLLRNAQAKAVSDAPLTLIARRPDGIEYRRIQLASSNVGGTATALELSATAPRGRWEVAAYIDPSASAVGRVTFDVQDFVPERLEVTLKPQAEFYRPGDTVKINVEGRFLYGAPASGMNGEGEVRLSVDADPFPDLGGYQFGRVEEDFSSAIISLNVPTTDEAGKTVATAALDLPQKTSHPLVADITLGLAEPGGRMTRAHASVPVRSGDLMIGIHNAFDDDWVRENTPAKFEMIAVDATGKKVARKGLTYRLLKEVVNYQWYEANGRWNWERQQRDVPLQDGKLDVTPDQPGTFSTTQEWGSYRLVVSDAASGASSSVRYWVGWGGSAGADRPDRVAVTLDKDVYKPGETATIDIRPPSEGKALIVIASNRIHASKLIDVARSGATFKIRVEREWGPGVYALITHYRGVGQGESRAPVRSIGLAWLGIDQTQRTLQVTVGAPKTVKPQSTIDIPIDVAGASGSTYLTLAAVDQGILQLTNFASPSPTNYFYGKRRLGLDIRDDYGRLIQAQEGAMGELRTGGDNFGGGEGLSVVPTRTVALFSGLVKLDGRGHANIKLDIPDYVGELRLMAVAYNDDQLGEASVPLTVRDQVVADLSLPRFLAPGDRALGTLFVHNVEGPAGRYDIEIHTQGAVKGDTTHFAFDLGAGAKNTVLVPITGEEPGIATVTLKLTGPGSLNFLRGWPIEVRPSQRPTTQERVAELAPGASLTLPPTLFDGYYPETARLSVTLASNRAYDVPALLRWLDRYPYGCLEQTTSRAYPLLVYNDLAQSAGLAGDKGVRARVQQAVDNVLDMQSGAGNFGMWGWGYDAAYDWLSVFALDFLTEARARNFVVPQDGINRGMGWLRGAAAQAYGPADVRTYAYYVLARQGLVNLADLRYYHDTEMKKIKTPLAAAHLGAALAELGDRSRAHSAFARAVMLAQRPMPEKLIPPYGSDLRDLAGVTALAAKEGESSVWPALFQRMSELKSEVESTTTQEKAWMLLAANALAESQGPLAVSVKGVAAVGKEPIYIAALKPGETQGVEVRNTGTKNVWYSIAVEGVSVAPLAAENRGVTISKAYYTPGGEPVDLRQLKQSDKVVVVIQGQMPDVKLRTMGVMDLLPAGLEIESPLVPGAESAYRFLPALTPASMQQKRDDRYVGAFNIQGIIRYTSAGQRIPSVPPSYALAYLARAVTPGGFVQPAATIEDMYAPGVRARTEVGALVVGGGN